MSSVIACEVCGNKKELLRCSRCKLVHYCSKEHQKKDWRSHKVTCKRLGLAPNSTQCSSDVQQRQLPVGGSSESEILNAATESLVLATDYDMAPRPVQKTAVATSGGNVKTPRHYPEVCLSPSGPLARSPSVDEVCQCVIRDLNAYGVCMVDNFLGEERGRGVLNEVLFMYNTGVFTDGELVSNKGDPKTVRGDQITWVNGREKYLPNIGHLISTVDAVIKRANTTKNNGTLGQYNIKGRTKAMVACYPGSGSHYVQHVDNPSRDGRCITAIYYLNLGWDVKRYGGLLRIFSGGPRGNTIADVEPLFDRLLFFWSDWRNPHEVQPAYQTRYAITLWYFDAAEREEALRRYEKERNIAKPPS